MLKYLHSSLTMGAFSKTAVIGSSLDPMNSLTLNYSPGLQYQAWVSPGEQFPNPMKKQLVTPITSVSVLNHWACSDGHVSIAACSIQHRVRPMLSCSIVLEPLGPPWPTHREVSSVWPWDFWLITLSSGMRLINPCRVFLLKHLLRNNCILLYWVVKE